MLAFIDIVYSSAAIVTFGIISVNSPPSREYSNLQSFGSTVTLINASWAFPSYSAMYGSASNSIVPFSTLAVWVTLPSAYFPFASLVTTIFAVPAIFCGVTVTVVPLILAFAISSLLDFTVSFPCDSLFITSKVPAVGYLYVASVGDICNPPASPKYIIFTFPFSSSFAMNLYFPLMVISAFMSFNFSMFVTSQSFLFFSLFNSSK